MFGFIIANIPALSPEEQNRYKSCYCGLCRALRKRSGSLSRLTLTYDMTFLILVLSSLYEDAGQTGYERCCIHPAHRHEYLHTRFSDYAADMNLALAYYNCLDNWHDDRNIAARGAASFLSLKLKRIKKEYPRQCKAISDCMAQLGKIEAAPPDNPDAGANCFGELMGELFVVDAEDIWARRLREFGQALGRFIYIMDACVDYESDLKHGSYSPLAHMAREDGKTPDFSGMLNMLAGECAACFERLPLADDLGILRNILYSGVWARYEIENRKRGGNNA
jgi:hypothetical protein